MTGIKFSCTKKTSINSLKHLTEAVDYVKTELMPDFDFDAYNHDEGGRRIHVIESGENGQINNVNGVEREISHERPEVEVPSGNGSTTATTASSTEEVDKW